MAKHEYKHFNPATYDIQVKISSVKTGSHCKHNINYHIIWIPKYRKKILVGKVVPFLKQIIEEQCNEMGLEMLALEVMPDHIHLFVSATPTHLPYEIVRRLKGNTSRRARQTFSDLNYLGYKIHYKEFPFLWARGYYIGSAGHVSQDAVKRYIMEQQGKDVFQFSVFGNKEQTIGDFTQGKLF
jgi:putative transposase